MVNPNLIAKVSVPVTRVRGGTSCFEPCGLTKKMLTHTMAFSHSDKWSCHAAHTTNDLYLVLGANAFVVVSPLLAVPRFAAPRRWRRRRRSPR